MATVAIGDVHGNFLALDDLLAKVTPTMGERDVLVLLGDYIDRGPDTRGCLDRIVRLKEEAKYGVVTLLGNHEAWMLRSLLDPTCHIWILALQSFATIRSYSTEAAAVLDREIERLGPRLIAEGLPLPYEAFFDSMPSSHLALLEICNPIIVRRTSSAFMVGFSTAYPCVSKTLKHWFGDLTTSRMDTTVRMPSLTDTGIMRSKTRVGGLGPVSRTTVPSASTPFPVAYCLPCASRMARFSKATAIPSEVPFINRSRHSGVWGPHGCPRKQRDRLLEAGHKVSASVART